MRKLLFVAVLAPSLVVAAPAPAASPQPVSPGEPGEVAVVTDRCPSFSWTVPDPSAVAEIAVYAAVDGVVEDRPVISQRLPAGASSWTPPEGRCLVPGETYGWAVRDPDSDGWSEVRIFRVAGQPSLDEVRAAIEVLRRHEAATGERPDDHRTPSPALAQPSPEGAIPRQATAGLTNSGGGPAATRVTGEVRTVDGDGTPRQWGRGRPGTLVHGQAESFCSQAGIYFGLSTQGVDWGSAAEACPAGTWVCRQSEIVGGLPCDTVRPDTTVDARNCEGIALDLNANIHLGWLADAGAGTLHAILCAEDGTCPLEAQTCSSFPVWCCFE
jgi:hypothetical protein